MRELYSALLSHHDIYGIFRKLVLNETPLGTDFGFWRMLGFVHLVSASGIHLYALQNFLDSVFFRTARLFANRNHLHVWKRVSILLSYLVILYAWYLSQFRFGLFRPFIIVLFRNAAMHLGFRWRFWSPLALSISLDLIVSTIRHLCGVPNAFFSGRMHYALAVGGGLAAIELLRGRKTSHLHFHFALSVGSWLPTAAYDALFEHTVAWATPILSLVSIPLFASVLYPLLLADCLVDPAQLWDVTKSALLYSNIALKFSAEAVMSWRLFWSVNSEVFLEVFVLFFLFGKYVLAKFQRCFILLTIIFLIRGTVVKAVAPIKTAQVEQWNVGQGDSAFVQTGYESGFIDTGTRSSLKSSTFLKKLIERNIFTVNWIALTHLDQDHAGALERWIKLVSVERIFLSAAHFNDERGVRIDKVLQKYSVPVSHQGFPGIWLQCTSRECKHKKNGNMSGFFLEFNQGRDWYLNLGDADKKDELILLRELESKLSKPLTHYSGERVFKISHHGSRYSTSHELMVKLRPTQTWISAGAKNRYGHPTHRVLELLQNTNVLVRRTDRDGDLVFETTK